MTSKRIEKNKKIGNNCISLIFEVSSSMLFLFRLQSTLYPTWRVVRFLILSIFRAFFVKCGGLFLSEAGSQ